MSFNEDQLNELDYFLSQAPGVVPYIDVARGVSPVGAVALRHDVDHSITKALRFAEWEFERGYRSSYYILHSAPYWKSWDTLVECVNRMVKMGHEVGLHNDALCERDGNVDQAAGLLIAERGALQNAIEGHYSILGVADHGGSPHTNGDIWDSYNPIALGFEYEAYQLQKTANTYISDNQGTWRNPLKYAQTFMLVHPTWWPV